MARLCFSGGNKRGTYEERESCFTNDAKVCSRGVEKNGMEYDEIEEGESRGACSTVLLRTRMNLN